MVSRSTLAHIDTPFRWASPFLTQGALRRRRHAAGRLAACEVRRSAAAPLARTADAQQGTRCRCRWKKPPLRALGPWAGGARRGVAAPLARAEASGRARVATAAGYATSPSACSELCVFTNTPSTRGTVAGGPDFLVLLITAMYAWLLVACRPRSAVACDRPALGGDATAGDNGHTDRGQGVRLRAAGGPV